MSRAAPQPTTYPLFLRVGRAAATGQVAAEMSCILQEIDAVLVPIIGVRGVSALFKRSVHVAGDSRDWLLAGHESPAALVEVLAARANADAAAGAEAYLREFHDLLVGLIGPSLTERMVGAVWSAESVRSTPQVSP